MKHLLRLCSNRKSRREPFSTSETSWATTKSVGMWNFPGKEKTKWTPSADEGGRSLRMDNSRGDSTFTEGMSQDLLQKKSDEETIQTMIDFALCQVYKVSQEKPCNHFLYYGGAFIRLYLFIHILNWN